MCGILAVFGDVDEAVRATARRAAELIRHRGPDGDGALFQPGRAALFHQRLAIMDPPRGHQPMVGASGAAVVHNGEIYNAPALRAELQARGVVFGTSSDSEVLLHLLERHGTDFVERLDGDFTFAAVNGDDWLVARDPIGVKPLFYGRDRGGRLWFASEMKALQDHCAWFGIFPPGHAYTAADGLRRYYRPGWTSGAGPYRTDGTGLRERLTAAVEKRLMSDVPLGVLLSGGLDSSILTGLTAQLLRRTEPTNRLPTFSIGLDRDAPDLVAAREVAAHLGTDHHEVLFSPEEGIAAIGDVIYHLESHDVAEIRSAIPIFLVNRAARAQGIKVTLCGEGSDEVFGGYLYTYLAGSAEAFQSESVSLVTNLHRNILGRVDKISMAHGIEARVPYLDPDFLDLAMTIDPGLRRPLPPGRSTPGRMEKLLLRAAFARPDPLIPPAVLWRQKEQTDDGVGYSWNDHLRDFAVRTVSDRQLADAADRFPHDPPATKEAYLYRAVFHRYFPGDHAARCITRWLPRWQADDDPSGRSNPYHHRPVAVQRDPLVSRGCECGGTC